MDFDLYNDTYDLFCELVAQNDASILEIGCGPGNITRYLIHKKSDFKITGIDVSPNMIKLAKRNNPNVDFMKMDCRGINKLNEKFDAIISGFTLPYLSEDDYSKLLSDCRKLLTTKGILYLSFVPGNYEGSGFKTGKTGDRMYIYYHEPHKLERELELNNFRIIKRFEKSYPQPEEPDLKHCILIARLSENS